MPSISASVSISAPPAQLTNMTPGFICAIETAYITTVTAHPDGDNKNRS